MVLEKRELVSTLEGIIDRLEDATSNALMIDDINNTDFQDSDIDADTVEEIEGMDAALLVAENRIIELVQLVGEETDNLKGLLETIEENQK